MGDRINTMSLDSPRKEAQGLERPACLKLDVNEKSQPELQLEAKKDDYPWWQHPFWVTKRNWRSALTVSLVNIPLSISLAIASGGSPMQGCATAIYSGLVAGFVGGSDYNIFGPAGALTSILNAYAVKYDEDILPWFSIWTGAFTFAMFSLKLERYTLYLPNSVMEGFTMAIAFLIGLNQLDFIFGLQLKKKEHFYENVYRSFSHLDEAKWEPLVCFGVFFPLLLSLSIKFPKVPWIPILAVIGIILGVTFEATELSYNPPTANQTSTIDLPTLKYKYGELSANLANFPKWEKQGSFADMMAGSLSVGFICVLETLITAKIADNIAGAKVPFDPEKEVLSTGIGNALVGVMGGLPCTAVLARTKLNIMSGTKGSASQFINSLLCVVIVVALLPFFSYVPLSIVACILMLIAVRMAPIETLIHLYKTDKVECVLMASVCIVSVGLDPTYGLVMGMVVAFFINADNVSKFHTEIQLLDRRQAATLLAIQSQPMLTVLAADIRGTIAQTVRCSPNADNEHEYMPIQAVDGSVACYEPRGALTYLNADAVEEQMKRFLGMPSLVIAMDKVYFMDVDGVDRIGKMVKRLRAEGTTVILCGCAGKGIEMLEASEWVQGLRDDGFVVCTRTDAYNLLIPKDIEMQEAVGVDGTAVVGELRIDTGLDGCAA